MVIECPSCKTKFAVDGAQLREVDAPRFHCSRCDHFFEKSRYELGLTDSPPVASAGASQETPTRPLPKPAPTETFAAPTFAASSSAASSSAASSSGPVPPSADFDDPLMDMPFEAEFDDEQLPDGLRMAIEEEAEAAKQLELIEDERVPEIHPPFTPAFDDAPTLATAKENISRKVETVSLLEDDDLPPIRAEWPGASAVEPQEVDLSDLSRSWAPGRGVGSSLKPTPSAKAAESPARGVMRAEPMVTQNPLSADAIDDLLGASAAEPKLDAVLRPEAPKSGDFTFERELLGGREFVPATPSQSPDWSLDASPRGTSTASASALPAEFEQVSAPTPTQAPERSASIVNFPNVSLPSFNLTMPHIGGLSASKLAARSAVGFVCSVPLALALVFWVWSKNIDGTPAMVGEALHLGTAGLPHLAPPTMELVDLASRSVTLDDGKRVLEITGSLLNATMKSYSGITLEARVFDAQNSVIDRMVVNLKNGLSGATVASLSPETLSELQQQGATNDSGVEPNGRVPFRLIFTAPHDQAAWFSTKIYSVTPSVG